MLLGRYEVIRKIGVGGFGEVLLARSMGAEGFERIVAVKRLKGELARQEGSLQGIINEARIGGLLSHPNVVQVLEFIRIGSDYLLVMEFVDGIGLQEVLELERSGELSVPPGLALEIIIQVCEGLHYAHAARSVNGQPLRLIHRDIKPSNIMITRTGTVKIMDFGVARSATNLEQSSTGSIKGTLRYLSPEQAEGSKEIGHASDLFSLALVLSEMLTGHPVYEADQDHVVLLHALQGRTTQSVEEANKRVPGIGPILRRCLAHLPADRYETAEDFAQDLRNLKLLFVTDQALPLLVEHVLTLRPSTDQPEENSTDTTFSLELRRRELAEGRSVLQNLATEMPTERIHRPEAMPERSPMRDEPTDLVDLEQGLWEWEWREGGVPGPESFGAVFDRISPPSSPNIQLFPTPSADAAPGSHAVAQRERQARDSRALETNGQRSDALGADAAIARGQRQGTAGLGVPPTVESLWGPRPELPPEQDVPHWNTKPPPTRRPGRGEVDPTALTQRELRLVQAPEAARGADDDRCSVEGRPAALRSPGGAGAAADVSGADGVPPPRARTSPAPLHLAPAFHTSAATSLAVVEADEDDEDSELDGRSASLDEAPARPASNALEDGMPRAVAIAVDLSPDEAPPASSEPDEDPAASSGPGEEPVAAADPEDEDEPDEQGAGDTHHSTLTSMRLRDAELLATQPGMPPIHELVTGDAAPEQPEVSLVLEPLQPESPPPETVGRAVIIETTTGEYALPFSVASLYEEDTRSVEMRIPDPGASSAEETAGGTRTRVLRPDRPPRVVPESLPITVITPTSQAPSPLSFAVGLILGLLILTVGFLLGQQYERERIEQGRAGADTGSAEVQEQPVRAGTPGLPTRAVLQDPGLAPAPASPSPSP